MHQSTMQEHIGKKLPDEELMAHEIRNQAEKKVKMKVQDRFWEYLHDKNNPIGNEQIFDGLSRARS